MAETTVELEVRPGADDPLGHAVGELLLQAARAVSSDRDGLAASTSLTALEAQLRAGWDEFPPMPHAADLMDRLIDLLDVIAKQLEAERG